MATILAYTTPAMGHLFPMCALLSELHDRGHDIALRTLTAGVDTGLRLGFATEAVDGRIEAIALDDADAPNPEVALKRALRALAERAAFEAADLAAAVAKERPDVVIVDANCWGAAAGAEAGELPWLSFWPFIPYLRSRGTPPWGRGLRPMPGLAGRVRDAVMRPRTNRLFNDTMVGPLNRVRARLGLAPISSVDDHGQRAPLKLVATAQPFDYAHPDWDDSIVMIGACVFDPPEATPDWLAAIDRPIVLVSTSSERQRDFHVARTAIDALSDEPVHVVVTFPAGVPPSFTTQSNVTICQFVPHGLVLDRAVCAVTHAGMGTTQRALARGVPVCVVPHGRDQFEVARRVEIAACGVRLLSEDLTPNELRDGVRRAMTMTEGASRVAAGYSATGGTAHGADLIEQRLLNPPSALDNR